MTKGQYLSFIKQAALDSTWPKDAIYENGGIVVTLKNGIKYFYENVPQSVYDAFMSSESKGTFLNKEIKPNYEYKQI